MFRKDIKIIKVITIVLFLLLIFTACEQNKDGENKKTTSTINTSSLTTNNQQPTTNSNLVANSSFEKGKIFNSGLYDEGKSPLGKPDGWKTKGQLLNDSTGWATDEVHFGNRSLKITNIVNKTSYWQGEPIILNEPANSLNISVWTKTKDLSKNAKLFIRLVVTLKPATSNQQPTTKNLDIKIDTSSDWTKTEGKTLFLENIVKVVPYLYLKGEETVWFDDLILGPNSIKISKGKLLFDSNNSKDTLNIKPLVYFSTSQSLDTNHSSCGSLYQTEGPKIIISSNFIPIKDGKIYKLSGDFKAIGVVSSRLLFGYKPYTKDKKIISRESVNNIRNTETNLVKDCKSTDKIIYIKNADNWEIGNSFCIAFSIDNSGKYYDLPNFNLSSKGINKIEKLSGNYKIELNNQCGKNYFAGTKVREHASGDAHIYNAASGQKLAVSNHFVKFNNLISTDGSPFMLQKFPVGTKYVRLYLRLNYTTPKATLQFKNLIMKEFTVLK